MDIAEIIPILNSKLVKQLIPARILLDKFRIIEESSRKTSSYTDPKYMPFYYYLGSVIKPKSMLEIGFKLGLLGGCFLKGCKSVRNYLAFQEKSKEYYSPRLGRANIKSCYKGNFDFYYGGLLDDEFSKKMSSRTWEFIIINEEKDYDYYRLCLDIMWKHLSRDGFIAMEYAISPIHSKKAFCDFCKIKNREVNILPTRYGTGLIQK